MHRRVAGAACAAAALHQASCRCRQASSCRRAAAPMPLLPLHKLLLLWLLRQHHHGKSCQGLNVVKREKGSVPGLLLREI